MEPNVKATASLKETAYRMTPDRLEAAVKTLRRVGVPGDANLKVNHFQQGGWEITAEWVPSEDAPAEVPTLPANLQPRDSRDFTKIQDTMPGGINPRRDPSDYLK